MRLLRHSKPGELSLTIFMFTEGFTLSMTLKVQIYKPHLDLLTNKNNCVPSFCKFIENGLNRSCTLLK